MEKPFIEINGRFSITPFDANPLIGYEAPKDFPNCCPYHKHVFEEAKKWYRDFPNCCKFHKAMAKEDWFDWWIKQNDYSGIAEKIIRQISYTEDVVVRKIDTDSWYKGIIDYIDYCVWSFGQPALGLHIYLGAVKSDIAKSDKVPKSKKKAILEFVEGYFNPPGGNRSVDLNLLYQAYQDWIRTFPFEVNSYFGDLKQQYEKRLPIIDGTPEVNLYNNVVKVKIVTKERLFQVLIDLTNKLLTQINGLALYEQGTLNDTNKIKLELIVAERKRKIEEGYKYNSPDETTRYKKMIQRWLDDEKRFIAEITPLITNPTAQSKTQPGKLRVPQIALIYVYEGKSITRDNAKEIANKYGHNSVQSLFQKFTYYSSPANRKGRPAPATPRKFKNKIELLQSVLPYLSEQAKQRASDEIQTLKQAISDGE